MPIAKAAATTPKPSSTKGPQCTIGKLLARLDKDDRVALMRIFDNEPRTRDVNRWISDFLEVDGHGRITHETIQRHRNNHPTNECYPAR